MKHEKSIGVLRFPCTAAGAKPMHNLVYILGELFEKVYVISGNEAFNEFDFKASIELNRVTHLPSSTIPLRAIRFIWTQIKLTISLLRAKDVDSYLFFDANPLILPMIFGKLLKKNIILILTDYPVIGEECIPDKDGDICDPFWNLYLVLSDGIILYTPRLLHEWDLGRYRDKTSVAHRHILDLNKLTMETDWKDRRFDVGFIGRFSPKKNVMGFLEAVSILVEDGKTLRFFLGGDGSEKKDVIDHIDERDLDEYITYQGWVPRYKLPACLNGLKLLVIPSYFEGLPNMMLEAMACGTIVLASRVGSIPDIIEDGINGFLLDDNSPQGIKEGVLRVFDHKNLEQIRMYARKTVEERFSKKAAVKNFRKVMETI